MPDCVIISSGATCSSPESFAIEPCTGAGIIGDEGIRAETTVGGADAEAVLREEAGPGRSPPAGSRIVSGLGAPEGQETANQIAKPQIPAETIRYGSRSRRALGRLAPFSAGAGGGFGRNRNGVQQELQTGLPPAEDGSLLRVLQFGHSMIRSGVTDKSSG